MNAKISYKEEYGIWVAVIEYKGYTITEDADNNDVWIRRTSDNQIVAHRNTIGQAIAYIDELEGAGQ